MRLGSRAEDSAGVAEIGGLIFVFAGAPAQMPAEPKAELRAALAPQGIDRAAVAHCVDHRVAANWKLGWQNNRECWHCHAGHPQYVRADFDIAPATARTRELGRVTSARPRARGGASIEEEEWGAGSLAQRRPRRLLSALIRAVRRGFGEGRRAVPPSNHRREARTLRKNTVLWVM